jgi:hypothetical protein
MVVVQKSAAGGIGADADTGGFSFQTFGLLFQNPVFNFVYVFLI